jgi:hypothetical protein
MERREKNMAFSLRRLGVGSLLASWGVYWAGLAGVTLGPFARWIWDLNQIPGSHGSASFSIGDAGATLIAMRDNVTVWTGVAPLSQLALWIAGPPLLLWLAWLALRPSAADRAALYASEARGALPDAARGGWGVPITPTSTPSPVERRDGHRS